MFGWKLLKDLSRWRYDLGTMWFTNIPTTSRYGIRYVCIYIYAMHIYIYIIYIHIETASDAPQQSSRIDLRCRLPCSRPAAANRRLWWWRRDFSFRNLREGWKPAFSNGLKRRFSDSIFALGKSPDLQRNCRALAEIQSNSRCSTGPSFPHGHG